MLAWKKTNKGLDKRQICDCTKKLRIGYDPNPCAWKRTNKGLDKRAKSVLGKGQIKDWTKEPNLCLEKGQIKDWIKEPNLCLEMDK